MKFTLFSILFLSLFNQTSSWAGPNSQEAKIFPSKNPREEGFSAFLTGIVELAGGIVVGIDGIFEDKADIRVLASNPEVKAMSIELKELQTKLKETKAMLTDAQRAAAVEKLQVELMGVKEGTPEFKKLMTKQIDAKAISTITEADRVAKIAKL